jgi:short-subunit dehydrogenase
LTEFGKVAGSDRSRLFKAGAMQAPAVAAHAYRAMMAGKAVAIPGLRNKLILQVQRVSSHSMSRAVTARLNQPARALSVRNPPGK